MAEVEGVESKQPLPSARLYNKAGSWREFVLAHTCSSVKLSKGVGAQVLNGSMSSHMAHAFELGRLGV